MIDWAIVAKIWAGYGVNIIVLTVLLLIAWIIGLVVERLQVKGEGNSKKG